MKALLLIDHGSRRNEANQLLETIAERVSERQNAPMIVAYAHMELANPTIEEAFSECVKRGATHITVHPHMLAPGRHVREDIPRMIEKVSTQFPQVAYRITEPFGTHPLLIDIILNQFHS